MQHCQQGQQCHSERSVWAKRGCSRVRVRPRAIAKRAWACMTLGALVSGSVTFAASPWSYDPHARPNGVRIASLWSARIEPRTGIDEVVLSPELRAYEPRFGASLAASARWLAVGAPMDHDDGNLPGTVHLYSAEDRAPLVAHLHEVAHTDSPTGGDRFGIAVALRFADTAEPEVIIGCDTSDELLQDAGCVRLFRLESSTLQAGAMLFSPRPEPDEAFGHALAASESTIVVGAPRSDVVVVGEDAKGEPNARHFYDSGRVYVFTRSVQSGAWHVTASLERETPESSAWFGNAVAVSGDWIAIGAPGSDVPDESGAHPTAMSVGEVTMFHRNAEGAWKLHTTLRPPQSPQFASFGSALAIDGETLVIGAPGYTVPSEPREESSAIGAAFVYRLSTATVELTQSIFAPDAGASTFFGLSLALSKGHLLVGAPGASDTGQSSGAAWQFMRRERDAAFTPIARLRAQAAGEMFLLGSSAALLPNLAIVGRFNDEESGHPRGSVHVFGLDSTAIATHTATEAWRADPQARNASDP